LPFTLATFPPFFPEFYLGPWVAYAFNANNCPGGTTNIDENCHVARFSVGTHGIAAGNEDVMFPEPTCGMTGSGLTEFCRVCSHSMLARMRGIIGVASDFTTIQNEVLGQFPLGAPFPVGQPSLTCP
jgi:hypothetical protein